MRLFDRFGRQIGVSVTLPYYFGVRTASGAMRSIAQVLFGITTGYRMAAAGWVVAHSCQYTVDVATSGHGEFEIFINGAPETLGVLRVESSDGTGDDGKHVVLGHKELKFKAGDIIGAFWAESGVLELDEITGLIVVALAV